MRTTRWVTIAIRGDDWLAQSAAAKLAAAGVPVRLLSDVNEPHTVAFHWAPRAILGGTAIQVDPRVVDEACDILGILTPADEALADAHERGPGDGDPETDREAHLALGAAVIGLFLLPGVAQIGSLLICARLWSNEIGLAARRKLSLAIAVDVVVLAGMAFLALREVGRWHAALR